MAKPLLSLKSGQCKFAVTDQFESADFRGMSPLTPVTRDLAGDDGMAAYKVKYLTNAASPNLLIKYAQKLQPSTVDSLRERMAARYGGPDNAGKTLILDQGADITLVGNSLPLGLPAL